MPRLMRHMGHEVIIHGKDGRRFRGFMDGVDPPRGVFIRDGFGRRRFFSFVFVAAIFTFREDDVYFKNLLKRYSENVQPFCPNTF